MSSHKHNNKSKNKSKILTYKTKFTIWGKSKILRRNTTYQKQIVFDKVYVKNTKILDEIAKCQTKIILVGSGITDGGAEVRVAPPSRKNVKNGPPVGLYFGN